MMPENDFLGGGTGVRRQRRRHRRQVEPVVAQRVDETEWYDAASIADQRSRVPSSVQEGAPVAAIFNLSDQAQLEAYNRLLAGTVPEGAPSVEELSSRPAFHEGKWYVFLVYRKLRYRKLVPDDLKDKERRTP